MVFPTQPLTVLDGVSTTGASAGAYGADGLHHLTLQIEGIVDGDILQIEASNDGATWDQVGDDITEDGIYAVELGAFYYRVNFTDDTGGGTLTATFNGG